MLFDSEAGLHIYEVTLGFRVKEEVQYGTSCLVQADDPEEVEEKVSDHLCRMDLDQDVWIEEISEPYGIEEYQELLRESENVPFPLLYEMAKDELKDFLGL